MGTRTYMVDHYAVLGAPRDAASEQIEQAWRALRAREVEAGAPEVRIEAIDAAHDVLGEPAQRDAYDQALAEWDGPLSADGLPVIMASAHGAARYMLLDNEQYDVLLGRQARYAMAESGHDGQLYMLTREAIEDGVYTPRVRRAHRLALTRLHHMLSLREGFAWDRIGGADQAQDFAGERYAALVDEALIVVRERFDREIDDLLAALPDAEGTELTRAQLRERAVQRFEHAAQEVIKVARERQLLTQERLDMVRARILTPSQAHHGQVIVEMVTDEPEPLMAFILTTEGSVRQLIEDDLELPEGLDRHELDLDDAEQLRILDQGGFAAVRYRHQEGLAALAELEAVLTDYYRPLLP